MINSMIVKQIQDALTVKQLLLEDMHTIRQIEQIVEAIVNCYKNDGKVLISGNGGSAADAQHMAGEFVSRFYFDRPPLSAIALTTDSSILTAIGNDYGYDKVFIRQVEAHAKPGDVYIAISTSGNSKNIVESLKICKQRNVITIGLTGERVGLMDDLCDYTVKVKSSETPRVQEVHLLIEHIICALVEEKIFSEYKK